MEQLTIALIVFGTAAYLGRRAWTWWRSMNNITAAGSPSDCHGNCNACQRLGQDNPEQ